MSSLSGPLLPMKSESIDTGNTKPAILYNIFSLFTKRTIRAAAVGFGVVTLLAIFSSSRYGPATFRASTGGEQLYNDILNETLGFEKLYSIIMPSRTDLRDSLQLAAALTDLKIDIVDGKAAPEDQKAFPPHAEDFGTHNHAMGAWRAHMDVLRMIVEQNISSAIVMESDVDWDIRIKTQMQSFAKASRLLTQPGNENEWLVENGGANILVNLPKTSPYGDDWDLLWLGHCGADLPEDGGHIPIGQVVYHDSTVPPIPTLKIRPKFKEHLQKFGNETRIVSHTNDNLCSIAYAISQTGARKFLYEMGIKKLDAAADLMFAWLCDGAHGRQMHKCLSVNPQLFNQHRAAGPRDKTSNIQSYKGTIEHSSTENIMYGTKVNFEALLKGSGDYIEWGHDWKAEEDAARDEKHAG